MPGATAESGPSTGAALAVLRGAYEDRLAAAREARRAGGRVVGLIGNTVPVELVLAAGCVPVLVAAEADQPTPTAEIYMEDVIAPETKSLFESAVQGTYEFLDLLVLSRPYAQLYYYLKEVYRLGRGPKVPPLHVYDLMQSQREAVRVYNRGRTEALLDRLARLRGAPIAEGDLRTAISKVNRRRALQRELLGRRWDGAMSGVEAMQALGAGYFMDPEAYADILATYLEELRPNPSLARRPRLLVLSSEPLSHVYLHAALESAGALVVAEDDGWGSRAPGADVAEAGPAQEAILDKYWLDTATNGVYPSEAREAWFKEHATRLDVGGVVFYLPPSDHQLGWDYPRLKRWVDEQGKPSLLLRSDAAQPEGRATIEAEAKRFLAELGLSRREVSA